MIYLRDRYAVLPDLRDSTVEDLQVTNLLMSDTNNNLVKQSQSVTAVITHRVRDGRSEGYEEWIRGISTAARAFPGHMGVSTLRPQPNSPLDYVIVLQFESGDYLSDWLNSAVRKDWIGRAAPLIQEQESIQILSGLEAWFQLPGQPVHKPPKRYKQAILVWLGVTSVALLISPLIAPLIAALPWVLRVAINVAVTVTLLTYVIMPQLTRLFKRWLFA
ncbi:MAG: antibiotic biosynthesis monooxygenase [Phormidesmis sp.]